MKLLRPPHVARKKNRNEHLWRDELVEDLTDVLSTSFLGRGPFPRLKAFHSELLTVTCSVAKCEVAEPARVGALLRGRWKATVEGSGHRRGRASSHQEPCGRAGPGGWTRVSVLSPPTPPLILRAGSEEISNTTPWLRASFPMERNESLR